MVNFSIDSQCLTLKTLDYMSNMNYLGMSRLVVGRDLNSKGLQFLFLGVGCFECFECIPLLFIFDNTNPHAMRKCGCLSLFDFARHGFKVESFLRRGG